MGFGRIYGWESIPPPPQKPNYLIEAQNRYEQAEAEWLALTDVEPLPHQQVDAALQRLLKAEKEYAAAKDRYYCERMAAAETQSYLLIEQKEDFVCFNN